MYENFKQVLFKLDAEKAHSVAEFFLRKVAPLPLVQDLLAWRFVKCDERLANTLDSVYFPNPVGISSRKPHRVATQSRDCFVSQRSAASKI